MRLLDIVDEPIVCRPRDIGTRADWEGAFFDMTWGRGLAVWGIDEPHPRPAPMERDR
jgi:hypothetical protein